MFEFRMHSGLYRGLYIMETCQIRSYSIALVAMERWEEMGKRKKMTYCAGSSPSRPHSSLCCLWWEQHGFCLSGSTAIQSCLSANRRISWMMFRLVLVPTVGVSALMLALKVNPPGLVVIPRIRRLKEYRGKVSVGPKEGWSCIMSLAIMLLATD